MPPTEELRRDRETARLRRGLPPLPRPSLASRVAASLKKSALGVLYNKMTHRRTVRILCLGDSLTAGYSQLGTVYHPYEDSLVKMLKKKFTDVDFDTVEDGVPGDRVRGGSFLSRMTERCTSSIRLIPFVVPFACDSGSS
jgi:lysophospholipase L1-like esterase